jgi:hypothetical protein
MLVLAQAGKQAAADHQQLLRDVAQTLALLVVQTSYVVPLALVPALVAVQLP